MRSLVFFGTAAAVLMAGPALAGEEKPAKEKMVCKTERFVGTHMSERICKPKEEWDNAKKRSQDILDRKRQLKVNLPSGASGG